MSIKEKNCEDCTHYEACLRWTDFPKQCGTPVCRHFKDSKQSEGKWIQESFKSKSGEVLHHTPTCSICGEANSFKTKFCPHCGAKMDGERKEP